MKHLLFSFILILILACDKNEAERNGGQLTIDGTGAFLFDVNQSNLSTSMNVFYHIPSGDIEDMPVLFVLHGAGRDASDIRNAWISEANKKGFAVISPEFTEQSFPGGNGYILGNVFMDGNNPSPQTLNPERDWTFSLIEPIFDEFKSLSGSNASMYNMYGFSAGAQFAHRFMFFKPNARFDKVFAAAAGWYTVPNDAVNFPYGLAGSPLEDRSLEVYFSKKLTLQIGTLDNNPNEPGLRRNELADKQGDNRYDRAYYMFNTSKSFGDELGMNFNWNIIETPDNDHSLEPSVLQASEVLY